MASAPLQPTTVRGDDQVAPQPIPQPQAPVSTPHKEAGPFHLAGVHSDTSEVSSQIEELIVPSEPEPIIQDELAEHGVEAVVDHEKPKITTEHIKVGLEPAKESTPVATQPSGFVQLPMTEEEAVKTIKTTKITESKHWLAMLIEKVYLQLRGKE